MSIKFYFNFFKTIMNTFWTDIGVKSTFKIKKMKLISFATKFLHYLPSELSHFIALNGLKILYNLGILRYFIGNQVSLKNDVNNLSKISKAWIIGNFINPELAPHPPQTAEVVSCDGTNISPMWIVATRSEKGPFGLVAEDLGNREYRGFFTSNTNIMKAVIDDINEQLKIKITI